MSYEAILESAHRPGHDHHRSLLAVRRLIPLILSRRVRPRRLPRARCPSSHPLRPQARSAAELVTALALEFQQSAPEASASVPWPQLVARFASAGACPKAIRAIQHSERARAVSLTALLIIA